MTSHPTPKQMRVLEAIRERIETTGISPTLDELCEATGRVAKSSMFITLKKLERHGLIRRNPAHARSITIVPPVHQSIREVLTLDLSPATRAELQGRLERVEALSPALSPLTDPQTAALMERAQKAAREA